jgi:hypothetical protein
LGGSSLARLMTALRPEGLREPPDRSPSSASRRGASSIFFPPSTPYLYWGAAAGAAAGAPAAASACFLHGRQIFD